MRRLLLAVVLCAVGAAAAFVMTTTHELAADHGPSSLESTAFSSLAVPGRTAPPPEPKFSRAIYASVKLAGSSVMLDACHGPIAVDLGDTRPVLVAEHDYCGGSAWMPKLNMGDAVRLTGEGVEPGTYVVTEIRFQIRREARVSDLPPTDVVLQTCVTKDKLVLVGLERHDASQQS